MLKAVWKYSGCGLTAGGGEPVQGCISPWPVRWLSILYDYSDNERLDREPTDSPRTSCIIYSLILYLCFVFTQTLGLASAGFCYISPHWAEQISAAVWSLCICRGVGTAEFLYYCTSLNHGFPFRKTKKGLCLLHCYGRLFLHSLLVLVIEIKDPRGNRKELLKLAL